MPKTNKIRRRLGLVPFFQFGSIADPWATLNPGAYPDSPTALVTLLNNVLKTISALAGVYVLVNFILAGYDFFGASGNPEKIALAWAKIWQSVLGLVIVLGAFIIAGVFGYVIYGNPTAIISPTIYGPGAPTPIP